MLLNYTRFSFGSCNQNFFKRAILHSLNNLPDFMKVRWSENGFTSHSVINIEVLWLDDKKTYVPLHYIGHKHLIGVIQMWTNNCFDCRQNFVPKFTHLWTYPSLPGVCNFHVGLKFMIFRVMLIFEKFFFAKMKPSINYYSTSFSYVYVHRSWK